MRKLVVTLLAALAVMLPALAVATPAQAATDPAPTSATTTLTPEQQAAADQAAAEQAAAEKAAAQKAAKEKARKERLAKKRAAEKRKLAREMRVWNRLAHCESTGRWFVDTGNGYYGGLQISPSTWRAFGGARFAGLPHRASKVEQVKVAKRIKNGQGWGAWPSCSRKIGVR